SGVSSRATGDLRVREMMLAWVRRLGVDTAGACAHFGASPFASTAGACIHSGLGSSSGCCGSTTGASCHPMSRLPSHHAIGADELSTRGERFVVGVTGDLDGSGLFLRTRQGLHRLLVKVVPRVALC